MKNIIRFLFFAVLLLSFSCGKRTPTEKKELVKLVIGLQDNCVVSSILVAKSKGYFAEENLDVSLKFYPSGKLAYKAMLDGKVEYVTTSDMVVASHGVDIDARIITVLADTTKGAWIIARTDKGINKPEDLSGKTIGTQKNSAVHYFLLKFIQEYDLKDFKIVFMPAKELPQALTDGKIDAFSMRNPMVKQAKEMLPGKTVEFYSAAYNQHFVLAGRKSWLDKNQGVSGRILNALIKAEKFIQSNKEQAIKAVADELPGNRLKEVREDFDKYEYKIELCQPLLLLLEDEAAIFRKNQTDEVPNFWEIMDFTPLKKVSPGKITVIGEINDD